MALARSASGPGGLSINTNSANSLFGSGTTPAAGMFGSTQASKPLFGASTTTTAPPSGNLFGATTGTSAGSVFGTAATSQPAAGGLFASTTTQAPTGGLFGAATTTSQPQSGGLFGTATTSAQPSTGLFGATSQPAIGGGLFSGVGTTQSGGGGLFGGSTSQPAQSGNLFGGVNNQNQSKPAASLFGSGSTQNPQPQQTSSMFPSLQKPQQQQSQQQQGFGGLSSTGLTLGQSTNQQTTVPGVRIDTANIRGTTRFNDLHDDLQTQIENMDKIIEQQIQFKNECYAIMPAHDAQLSNIPDDVEFCRRKLIGLDAAMASDAEAISKLQKLAQTDSDHGRLSFRAIDNLRLPPQYHLASVWPTKSTTNGNQSQAGDGDSQDIVGYFSSATDELTATLNKYQKNITEIEQHLRNVEATSAHQVALLVARRNGASGSDDDAVKELAGALGEFEQGILHVAGKVGGVREGVQILQLGGFEGSSNGPVLNGKRSGIY